MVTEVDSLVVGLVNDVIAELILGRATYRLRDFPGSCAIKAHNFVKDSL